MELQLDLTGFCSALRKSESGSFTEKLCDTPGQRYLLENVIHKFVTDTPVRICDIDFNAFDEEDIVDFIDNKEQKIDEHMRGAFVIAKEFQESRALTAVKRRFF